MRSSATEPGRPPSTGAILIASGVFDVALGAGFYLFNPLGLEAWINSIVGAALAAAGLSVVGLGYWLRRRRRESFDGGRPRLIE